MKKPSRGALYSWMLIAAMAAGGTFLAVGHFGYGGDVSTGMSAASDADIAPEETSAVPSSVPTQIFSDPNDGYSLRIPASWSVEHTGADAIALHPAASSSAAACKIEVSAFPFSPGADTADWISHRIGADPSLSVAERSSEAVSVDGGTGVKWVGTIDDIPTTLVYIFSDQHAYEVAPSVIAASNGAAADGSARCDDMLQTFLPGFTI